MRALSVHFFTSHVHEQGTYFRSHNLAAGLVRLGHRVTVFGCDVAAGAAAREEERDGIRYVIVPEGWKPSVFSTGCHPWTTFRRLLRPYPSCDVGHLFQPFLGAAAAWARSPSRVRFYDWDDLWAGGLMTGRPPSWRQRWPWAATAFLERRLPRWAGRVTAVGGYLAGLARDRGATHVTNLYNGYSPAPFAPKAEARAKLGLQVDALYAGFMGRTIQELDWCFDAFSTTIGRHPRLRFAICGSASDCLSGLSPAVRERVDHLGQLPAVATRDFAAAIDLGLLPLADTDFNRSRYPIKFAEHLSTGNPLLYSEVGEIARLATEFGWAWPAGTTREAWVPAFGRAVDRLSAADWPVADLPALARRLSWDGLSGQLEATYHASLAACTGQWA